MAYHIRRQIRDAVATRLTGLSTTGARVYVNNVDPLAAGELPALTIRNGPESIEVASLGMPNPLLHRDQMLIVTANARATATVWNTLDQILAEVEVALLGTIDGWSLGGLAKNMTLSIEEPQINGDGDRMVGTVDVQVNIQVDARAGIPDAALP